jgi:hypothetical protein
MSDGIQPTKTEIATIEQYKQYKHGLAKWAESQLHGKDLIALATGNRFLVAIRKLCTDQYAVVDLINSRFKVVSTPREAIEEYFSRIALADVNLDFSEWENKFFDQKELNWRLEDWHSHVRRYLCENTECWTKEERSRRINIVLGILGLLILPLSFWGVDFRLAIALGLISAGWAWLRVKK